MFLGDKQFPFRPVPEDIEAKEIGDRSTFGAFKAAIEFRFELIQHGARIAGNELVIHMNREKKERAVGGESVDPYNDFLSNRTLLAGMLPPCGGIDGFLEFTIEECCFDVYLVAFQVQVVDEGEEDPDGVLVGNTSIELIVVHSRQLRESLGYPSSLERSGLACFPINLSSEDPFGLECANSGLTG